MRQLVTIAVNAFMELVRQPIFLLLMTFSASFMVFLSSVYYFGFGDDMLMTKQSVLAVMFVTGLFCASLSASAAVAHEIRSGTALAVLAKPVSKMQFLLGKYLGLAGALTVLTYINFLAALLASRLAFDAYGSPDKIALSIFFGLMLLAYALAGFTNYFLRRPFVPDAVFGVIGLLTVAFIVINLLNKEGEWQAFGKGVDTRMIPATILILFSLWILAGIALACSTRLEMIPTLAICSGVFLIGLTSDYLFGRHLGKWWADALYTITPNWQLFWLSDALEKGKTIPWSYVSKALAYMIGYLGAVLSVALLLFEDRELS